MLHRFDIIFVLQKWRRRWFVLRQGAMPGQFLLHYYTDPLVIVVIAIILIIILIAPCHPHCYPHYPFVIHCTITAITISIVITIAIIENPQYPSITQSSTHVICCLRPEN